MQQNCQFLKKNIFPRKKYKGILLHQHSTRWHNQIMNLFGASTFPGWSGWIQLAAFAWPPFPLLVQATVSTGSYQPVSFGPSPGQQHQQQHFIKIKIKSIFMFSNDHHRPLLNDIPGRWLPMPTYRPTRGILGEGKNSISHFITLN